MNASGQRGRTAGISMAVIIVIIGAICLGVFLLFRRLREKNRAEALIQANDYEIHHLDSDDDTAKAGCQQMRVHYTI